MILSKRCTHCGQFLLAGYENEFKEIFCDSNCYMQYCVEHGYTPNMSILKFNNIMEKGGVDCGK